MERLLSAMATCMQTSTQNVTQHGQSVVAHHTQLMNNLRYGTPLPDWWRMPEWTKRIGLLDKLPSDDVMREYHTFHDCGKPYCRIISEDGRAHYPGHAAMSERVWSAVGGNPHAARLMAQDMDAHLLKSDGIQAFAAKPDAVALLLTALSETHSNAAMFGGTDSDSFKIKCRALSKNGAKVIALLQAAPALALTPAR